MKPKSQKRLITAALVLAGAGYFSLFSGLDAPLVLKGYIAIVPFQVCALIYVFYFLRGDRRNVKSIRKS